MVRGHEKRENGDGEAGVLEGIFPDERRLVLRTPDDKPQEIQLSPGDMFYVNGKESLLRDLAKADRVETEWLRDSYGKRFLQPGDEIVLSELEHHANLVPWVMLCLRKGAILKRIPITVCGHFDLSEIDSIITSRTKLVAVSHVSNVLGTINPVEEVIRKAHAVGAVALVDGAQDQSEVVRVNGTEMDVSFLKGKNAKKRQGGASGHEAAIA